MNNQSTKQWFAVLRTYRLHRPWVTFFMLQFFIMVAVVRFCGGSSPKDFWKCSGFILVGALASLISHVKEQFAHPRSKLMPNFMASHVGILGILLLVLLVIIPAIVSCLSGLPLLGTVSFAALFGAVNLWVQQTKHPRVQLFAMPLYLLLFFSVMLSMADVNSVWIYFGINFWIESNPDFTFVHSIILITSWIGISLWLRQLTQAAEETTRVPSNQGIQGLFSDRWLEKIARQTITTNLDRQRTLRYGMTPTPPLVRNVFGPILAIGMALSVAFLIGDKDSDYRKLAIIVGMGYCIFGSVISSGILLQKRTRLSQELMLPMTRRSLIDGILRAIVNEATLSACSTCVVTFVATYLLMPEYITPVRVAAAGLAILSIQPFLVGSSFSVVLITSQVLQLFAMTFTICVAVAAAVFLTKLSIQFGLVYGAILSLCIAGFGVGMIQVARNEWMRIEFGDVKHFRTARTKCT